MQAVCYRVNPAGWVTCRWLRYFWGGCLVTPLNGLSLCETPAPELPADDWVRVRTQLGGICGSDAALVAQKQPPDSILQAYSSLPAVLGHENVSIVEEVGAGVDSSWVGKRVCVEPTLCCSVRGIDPPCPRCRAGQYGICESFGTDGEGIAALPPAPSIGYNARTGGAFGEYFTAHVSQLVEVPPELLDEQALLVDPFSCSMHAVLRVDLSDVTSVLVYGAGVMGLGVIASLRAIGYTGKIHALERAAYLERIAAEFGADEFLRLPKGRKDRFERIAELTGAQLKRVRFGNYMLTGGYDVVFDCVGSVRSINEALKWTRSRGQVVMVATGHGGRLDITPLWFTELNVLGAHGRALEHYGQRRIETYKLVQELMIAGKLRTGGLLTHTFGLGEYRRAFEVALNKSRYEAVKVAFDFR
ncbi:MAG: zinc-dependent alcohol dehydrogenase [Planctomycetota bacterium]|jgi:threonine dehydrogenase-like Zn-dependent dehydrogenase